MKIAIIGHKRIPSNEGGIEKGVEMHAVRMAARGHQVVVYNRGGHNIFGKEYDRKRGKTYKGVRMITVPTVSGRACVPFYSFLATLHAAIVRYDVVSYRASGSCIMIPLAKLFGLRCVASLHGIDSKRDKWGRFARWYLELGERMAAMKADVCLVLSSNMKSYIKKTYGTDSLMFANGITQPEIRRPDKIQKQFGLEKDSYILSLGRIVPEKGIHILIKAFQACHTDKKLVIAGGAEENSRYYEELIRLAAGDKRILFTGFVRGQVIGELYSNAWIFVLPSNLEGMANSLLEAMSYGCCCLVSDIPENMEVVGDHAASFRKGDEEDLRAQLTWLLENPDRILSYRSAAAEHVLSRYSWDRVVDQMLEVYRGNLVEYQDMIEREQ